MEQPEPDEDHQSESSDARGDGSEEGETIPAREWLLETRESKVRYGRATLTIARWGAVALSDTGEVIGRWREGEATPEDVAWAFVRSRVIDHSPSFEWEGADLGRLVELVAEVAHDPAIKARTVEELAPELDRIERDEREQWRRARESMAKSMKSLNLSSDIWKKIDLIGQFKPPDLGPDYSKVFRDVLQPLDIKGLIGPQLNLAELTGASDISRLMRTTGFAEMARAQDQVMSLGNISDLIGDANRDLFNVVNQSLFSDLRRFTASDVFSQAFGDRTADFRRWIDNEDLAAVVNELVDAARDLGEPKVAEAAEEAAGLGGDDSPEETLEELAEEIARLRESIEANDSFARQITVAFAAWLIQQIIVVWLVAFGVHIPGVVPEPGDETDIDIEHTREAPEVEVELDIDVHIDADRHDDATRDRGSDDRH